MAATCIRLICSTGAKQIISAFHRSCLLTNLAKWVFGIAAFFFFFPFKAKGERENNTMSILKTKPTKNLLFRYPAL